MSTQDVFWPATRNDVHWGIWSAAALVSLITLGRATAGVLPGIAPGWVLLAAAGIIACNLLTWWWSLPLINVSDARGQIARGTIAVCPSLLVGVVLAGSSPATLIAILAVAGFGIAFVIVHVQQSAMPSQAPVIAPLAEPADDASSSPHHKTAVPDTTFDDPLVQQQIIRRRTETGAECLEALLRIEFAANQRETSIHLPIQPAFSGVSEVECEPLDDSDVDLKVAMVHPFGVRIDVKRSSRVEEAAMMAVGVEIHSAETASAAAA